MPRSLNLRQVEIFKAVIEYGTVSKGAEVLNISQPAASKLLMQLESDHGLKLFDRAKGRLTPTPQGMRLYQEIERIFSGVRQVESAIGVIRREDQARLMIGIPPALAGVFIQRAIGTFLEKNPKVMCSITTYRMQWLAEQIVARKLDVGIVPAHIDNPYIVSETMLHHPMICILPLGHPLAEHKTILAEHLHNAPFVAFSTDTYTGRKVQNAFEMLGVAPHMVLTADANPTICQFVAAGFGVSLVDPMFVVGMEDRFAIRPFAPEIPAENFAYYARDARNKDLILAFISEVRATAALHVAELQKGWS